MLSWRQCVRFVTRDSRVLLLVTQMAKNLSAMRKTWVQHKKPRLGGNTQRVGNLWWCVSLSAVVSLGAHVLPCIPFATILSTPFAWTMTAAPHLSPISALAILYPHAASYIGVRAIFSEHKSVCVTLLVKHIKASHCFFFKTNILLVQGWFTVLC